MTKRNFLVTFLHYFGSLIDFWPLYEVGDWMNIVSPSILSGALPASVQNTPSQHNAQQILVSFFFPSCVQAHTHKIRQMYCISALNTFVLFISMNTLEIMHPTIKKMSVFISEF